MLKALQCERCLTLDLESCKTQSLRSETEKQSPACNGWHRMSISNLDVQSCRLYSLCYSLYHQKTNYLESLSEVAEEAGDLLRYAMDQGSVPL